MILLILILLPLAQSKYAADSPLKLDENTTELSLNYFDINDPNNTYATEARLGKAVLAPYNTQVIWYDATFHCDRKDFCIVVYYQEHDWLSFYDELTYVELQCSHTNTLHHRVMVVLDNDDEAGWWVIGINIKKWFSPRAKIYHDCAGVGNLKFVEHELPSLPNNNMNIYYESRVLVHKYEHTLSSDDNKAAVATIGSYHYWFHYPINFLMKDWENWEDMRMYEKLFQEKPTYWEPKNVDGKTMRCAVIGNRHFHEVCEEQYIYKPENANRWPDFVPGMVY